MPIHHDQGANPVASQTTKAAGMPGKSSRTLRSKHLIKRPVKHMDGTDHKTIKGVRQWP